MKFSEKMGLTEVRNALQHDGMNEELRNSLWNVLDQNVWQSQDFLFKLHDEPGIGAFSRVLWSEFFKRPIDERPVKPEGILKIMRDFFFDAPWYEVYDFIEFCLWITRIGRLRDLPSHLNKVLERELSGYRVADNQIVPISDVHEIQEIEEVVSRSPFSGAREHIRQAVRHLSHKEAPDYRNSIKEAISAVESACREVTNSPDATLGDALKEIEKKGEMHGALKSGLSSLYGYTSDEEGIRHAMLDEPNLTQADAKYMLVLCAAFVNYLAEKNIVRV